MRRPTTMGLLWITLASSIVLNACGDETRNLRTGFGKMELPDPESGSQNKPQAPGTGDATPGPKAPTDNVKPTALNWDGSTTGDSTYDVLVTE